MTQSRAIPAPACATDGCEPAQKTLHLVPHIQSSGYYAIPSWHLSEASEQQTGATLPREPDADVVESILVDKIQSSECESGKIASLIQQEFALLIRRSHHRDSFYTGFETGVTSLSDMNLWSPTNLL